MSLRILLLAVLAVALTPLGAAAKSCSAFASIKSYDADKSEVALSFGKGSEQKFFPRTEGAPFISKLPKKCSGKVKKKKVYVVKASGGRMTVTQIRENRSGKMRNDTEDKTWLGTQLEQLVADKTQVAVVIRPGLKKDSPLGVTTIYLPISEEELKEIERLESEVSDVE